MNRRKFVSAAAVGGVAAAAPADAKGGNAILELRRYQLRNDIKGTRVSTFVTAMLPAAKRAGIGPIGLFQSTIAPESPFVLALLSYPSWSAMEQAQAKLARDAEYQKAFEALNSMSEDAPYVRFESSILRSFDVWPQVDPGPQGESRKGRLFELRMYESKNEIAAQRKIKMFNDGEAMIFKRLGMQPVFFGQTLVGRNMPNLVYMLSYENLAARDKVWGAFRTDPEWQKLRATPGLSDPEIVTNITNMILSPLPASPIR
jgi:hypothetical protein